MLEFIKSNKFYILGVVIVFSIPLFISLNFSVLLISGPSMSPTYQDGDIVVMKKQKTLENNQIVVFSAPKKWDESEKRYIKRVIATEGDKYLIEKDKITINSKHEFDISKKTCNIKEPTTGKVPDGKFLVLGDNKFNSNDSMSQYCNGNLNFFVDESNLLIYGAEFKKIGGLNQ